MDIFTRMIHGIRLKYAAVSVVFLAVSVTLFYLGGPRAFGWYDFFAVFTLVLMVLTLFLMQCHYVIGPIERLSAAIGKQRATSAAKTQWVDAPRACPCARKRCGNDSLIKTQMTVPCPTA